MINQVLQIWPCEVWKHLQSSAVSYTTHQHVYWYFAHDCQALSKKDSLCFARDYELLTTKVASIGLLQAQNVASLKEKRQDWGSWVSRFSSSHLPCLWHSPHRPGDKGLSCENDVCNLQLGIQQNHPSSAHSKHLSLTHSLSLFCLSSHPLLLLLHIADFQQNDSSL